MKVLLIGAHQDDVEFRGGGLAALLKKNGHEVQILSVSNGSGGHHLLSRPEVSARRAEESGKVAAMLGVQYDVWSDVEDCEIIASLEMRRRMTRYIRAAAPDVIITHRTNDYHTDHRNTGLIVQDASYLLIVPNECPDVPALRRTPVILQFEDSFTNPPFRPDVVVDIDCVADTKLRIADANVSQVYEWLPYTAGELESVPPESDPDGRFEWLCGMKVTAGTTDEEIMSAKRGYAVRFARTAARFRKELIERYGAERGGRIRFAEAFSVSEYGAALTAEQKKQLFYFEA
ncbi:MAG: PIG-L family deacetylase [Oscillospiraceae bacterium]|nr:PIG-L family deacetylase [Oscillospiraceae bacterium]